MDALAEKREESREYAPDSARDWRMSRLTRDGTTAEPVSRDKILRRERGQGNINFPCSADHEQDWQPYPVDPYSSCYTSMIICVTIHTYTLHLPVLSLMYSIHYQFLRACCNFEAFHIEDL